MSCPQIFLPRRFRSMKSDKTMRNAGCLPRPWKASQFASSTKFSIIDCYPTVAIIILNGNTLSELKHPCNSNLRKSDLLSQNNEAACLNGQVINNEQRGVIITYCHLLRKSFCGALVYKTIATLCRVSICAAQGSLSGFSH